MITFIKQRIMEEKIKYFSIWILFTILATFEYISCAFYYSNVLTIDNAILVNGITLLQVLVLFMTILFINHFFTETKKQEFSIILLSGRTTGQVLYYLAIQYGTIFLTASILGYGLGTIALQSMQVFLQTLVIDYLNAMILFLILVGLKLFTIMMINMGVFSRLQLEITTLISNNYKKKKINIKEMLIQGMRALQGKDIYQDKETKKLIRNYKIRNIVGVIVNSAVSIGTIYFLIQIALLSVEIEDSFSYYVMAVVGVSIMITTTIPFLYRLGHRIFFLKKPNWLVGISNTMDLNSSMRILIILNATITPCMLLLLCLQSMEVMLQTYIFLVYGMLLIMLFSSIIFRFYLLSMERKDTYQSLAQLGFDHKNIKKVMNIEIDVFCFFILLLPFIANVILIIKCHNSEILETTMMRILIGSQGSAIIICLLFMKYQFRTIRKGIR